MEKDFLLPDILKGLNRLCTRVDHINNAQIDFSNTLTQLRAQIESVLWKVSVPVSYIKNDWNRSCLDKFLSELEKLNYEECYKKLIANLDDQSITIINKILGRIAVSKNHEGVVYDLFDNDEIEIIKRLPQTFWNCILRLNDNCYAYHNYFLPINHFEVCVFRDKHEIENTNKDYFKDKDIIDAGGFIGDSAIIFSDYTSKNVYSFEPTKENYEIMLKTLKLNNKKNVIPVNIGLGDKKEEKQIFFDGSASGLFETISTKRKENIQLITLDSYVEEHNLNVGLIKSDLEGFEQPFLRGAEKTIKRQKPTLLISIYHCADDFFKIKPMIESWNLGYKFKVVKPVDGNVLLETMLIAEIEK
ncbi:MAG: FkbM family methyltransferase [Alphaproteobacteria bacterium]|nr:FkbM family methyltransferase [Alphaproteobacteria bacterium]